MAEVNPRYKHDPKASPSLAAAPTAPFGPTGIAQSAPEPEVVVEPEAVEPEAE